MVFNLFIWRQSTDKKDICETVVEHSLKRWPAFQSRQSPGVDGNRHYAGVAEPEFIQFATVIFGVTQG